MADPQDIQKRDYLFDNIKALLIFSVALVHMLAVFTREVEGLSYRFAIVPMAVICAFHMPMFIFVSGYFSKRVEKSLKNAANLALTYVITHSLFMLYYMIVSGHDFTFREWLTPRFSMWYLFSLIFMRLLLPVFSRSRKCLFLLIPVTIFFVVLDPADKFFKSLMKFSVFYSYFMIGYFTDRNMIDRIRAVPRGYHALLFAACVGSMVFIRLVFHIKFSVMRAMMLHEITVFDFPSVPAGYAFSAYMFVIAILFTVSVIGLVPDRELWMSHIGKNVLPIYIMQAYAVLVTAKIIRITGAGVNEAGAVAISVIVSVFVTVFFGNEKTARVMNKVLSPKLFR